MCFTVASLFKQGLYRDIVVLVQQLDGLSGFIQGSGVAGVDQEEPKEPAGGDSEGDAQAQVAGFLGQRAYFGH